MGGLSGLRVLITRDPDESARTAEEVARRGGVPVVFPCIAFAPPSDPHALRHALARWRDFDRLILTSPRGALAALEVLERTGEWAEAAERGRFFAVGEATARVLRRRGLREVRVPERWQGEGLLEAVLADGAARGRSLLVRAEEGREVLPEGIRAAGGSVEVVAAYRTVRASPAPEEVEALLAAGVPEVVLFFSPSAFDAFRFIVGEERGVSWLRPALTVAVGPVTGEAMRRAGLEPGIVAPRPSPGEVLDAVERARSSGSSGRI